MTESEPEWPGLDTQPGADPLAARLLAAQRALTVRDLDPDVRTRLHLRFMTICTSLKMPAANRARGAQRLDRLIADAQLARRGTCAASARPASLPDPAKESGGSGRQAATGYSRPTKPWPPAL